MQPFHTVTGPAAALPAANVDTDVIMPKQFLKGIDRGGLARGALHDLRFDATGGERPGFALNRPAWANARFLVVGPNFGCGSSREHAVWGLLQLGIRAVIGTTFAGIFADNAANNGLLLIGLDAPQVAQLTSQASDEGRNVLTVDLPGQLIRSDGLPSMEFEIGPTRKNALIRGLDAIGSTLDHAEEIRSFEARHHALQPWLATTGAAR